MDTSAAATAPTTSGEATTAPTAMDTSAEAAAATTAMETSAAEAAATAPTAMATSATAAAAPNAIMDTSATAAAAAPNAIMDTSTEAAAAPTAMETSAEATATTPTAMATSATAAAAPNAMDTSTEAAAAPTAMETSAAAVAPTSMDTSAAEAAATAPTTPTAMATTATAAAAPNAIMDTSATATAAPNAMDISAASEAAKKKKKKIEEDERAVEVETFLVDKLESDINHNVPPWSGKFKKCKKLLKDKLEAKKSESAPVDLHLDLKFRARFRRKVHLLTNLMADHHSFIDRANLCFGIRLLQIHKQIEADLSDSPPKHDKQRIIHDHTERVPSRPSLISTYGLNYKTQGINVDLMSAENLLLCRDYDSSSPEFNAVGICGAEGVGKTTLALELFHKREVKSLFFPRIWICLTDRRKDEADDSYEMFVAKRILMHLGFHGERIQAGERFREEAIRAIRSELRRKRYLVVVDGVSEEMEDKEMMKVRELLREALPKGTEGALVVTGRAENMVKKMVGGGRNVVRRGVGGEEEKGKDKEEEEKRIHNQLPLVFPEKPEGWDWEIFKKAADDEGEKTMKDKDERLKVKNEVVKRSHGLPWGSTLLGIIRRELQIKNKPETPTTTATATAPTTTTTTPATTSTTTTPPPPPPPPPA